VLLLDRAQLNAELIISKGDKEECTLSHKACSSREQLFMGTLYGRSYIDLATNDWLFHERFLVRNCLPCALDDMAPQVQYRYGVVINERCHKYIVRLRAQNISRDW
jgi:hypothetical protein